MTTQEAQKTNALETEETTRTPEGGKQPKRTKQPKDEAARSKRTVIIVIVIAAVLVTAMAGVLIWALNREETFNDEFFDPLAQTGLLPDMSEEEIEAELNRVVEEGQMNISISGRIIFEDGTSEGRANIVNSDANHYIQKVTITLDETGEEIYASGGIRPGQYIRNIRLSRDLEPGTYETTAIFQGYTEEERQLVGTVAAKVELIVKN